MFLFGVPLLSSTECCAKWHPITVWICRTCAKKIYVTVSCRQHWGSLSQPNKRRKRTVVCPCSLLSDLQPLTKDSETDAASDAVMKIHSRLSVYLSVCCVLCALTLPANTGWWWWQLRWSLAMMDDSLMFSLMTPDFLSLSLCVYCTVFFNLAPSTSLTLLPKTLVFLSATTTTTTVSRVSLCSVDDDDHHNHSLIHSHTQKVKKVDQCNVNLIKQ